MFKLEAKPIFTADVEIPIPGLPSERIKFDFKHKTRTEFDALAKAIRDDQKTVEEAVREIVVGWNAPGTEFTDEALNTCFELFPGSPFALFTAYRSNLIEGRRKN